MTDVTLGFTAPIGDANADLVVLGHSLGTSAALWQGASAILRRRFRVMCWELPGHGEAEPARGDFQVEDLTDALISHLDAIGADRFHYAGVSIGGCVGLDLSLRFPERVATAAIISTGARVDSPEVLHARAAATRADGVESFVEPFRGRWFAPMTTRDITDQILKILAGTDTESYALAADALADFDVWDLTPQISTPILAVGGVHDSAVPPARSIELAARVQRGTAVTIPDAGHNLVAEQPKLVAEALTDFIAKG